jgi:hypothetical protein
MLVDYNNCRDKQGANSDAKYLAIYKTTVKYEKNMNGHSPDRDVSGSSRRASKYL